MSPQFTGNTAILKAGSDDRQRGLDLMRALIEKG